MSIPATTAHDTKVVRSPADASAYLNERYGVHHLPSYLAKLRCVGGGPAFQRAGRRVNYTTPALDEYARQLLSGPFHSTAEYARAREDGHASAETKMSIGRQSTKSNLGKFSDFGKPTGSPTGRIWRRHDARRGSDRPQHRGWRDHPPIARVQLPDPLASGR